MTNKSSHIFHCKINELRPLTDTVLQLFVEPNCKRPFQYEAGQYVEVYLKNGEHCPYSIANAPLGSKQLEFHIRHIKENPFTHALFAEIKQTGTLNFAGPFGHCIYHKLPKLNNLYIAGGTGFAPIKAIIEQALAEGDSSPMHLYWGVKAINDLYLDDMARHWDDLIPQFHYHPVLRDPQAAWQGAVGLVQTLACNTHQDLSNFRVYCAGPPELVFATQKQCLSQGLADKQFFSDFT